MDLELEQHKGSASITNTGKGMQIDIQGLRFRYPEMERNILDNINLQITPGEKVCITGQNGSGKSTLISLLAALYSNQAGSVAYDGLPAGNIDTESLRDQIGACLTEEKIFQGTLAENIHLGRQNVTLEAVRHAASEMGLDAFVQQLPQGLIPSLILKEESYREASSRRYCWPERSATNPDCCCWKMHLSIYSRKSRRCSFTGLLIPANPGH